MPHTSKFKWYSLKWNHVCTPVITAAAHDLMFGASDNRVGFLQGLGDGAPAKQHTSDQNDTADVSNGQKTGPATGLTADPRRRCWEAQGPLAKSVVSR